jgi:hypothetical protein
MGRPKLTSLLSTPGGDESDDTLLIAPIVEPASHDQEPDPAPVEEPPVAEPGAAPQPARKEKKPRAATPRRTAQPRSAAAPQPTYLQFDRKEARLRSDQLTELTIRARQLNKQKNPDADRITDNTLIRVAVDLLLSRSGDLAGGDEAELRRSLGLAGDR